MKIYITEEINEEITVSPKIEQTRRIGDSVIVSPIPVHPNFLGEDGICISSFCIPGDSRYIQAQEGIEIEVPIKDRPYTGNNHWYQAYASMEPTKRHELLRKICTKYGSKEYWLRWLGTEPPCPLYDEILEYAKDVGHKVESDSDIFDTERYVFEDGLFSAELIYGQGTVVRIRELV